MKSKSSRRGFLALLGTAPIAAPVVAKDAAATRRLSVSAQIAKRKKEKVTYRRGK